MMNILDMILIDNVDVDKTRFRNLYYSFDDVSFVGYSDLFYKYKIYSSYEIINHRKKLIGEKHTEDNFIVKCDKYLFVRILCDNDSYIYDILVQSIDDLEKYTRIFFTSELVIPDSIKNLGYPIVITKDNHIILVGNNGLFTKHLGYEDWDFENKKNNYIDVVSNMSVDMFKSSGFDGSYEFEMNSGVGAVRLYISCDYMDGFYLLKEIRNEK